MDCATAMDFVGLNYMPTRAPCALSPDRFLDTHLGLAILGGVVSGDVQIIPLITRLTLGDPY